MIKQLISRVPQQAARLRWVALLAASTFTLSGCGAVVNTSWSNATLAQDTLYVAFDSRVFAVNPATGVEQWRFDTEKARGSAPVAPAASVANHFFSAPTVLSDQVVLATYNQVVFGLQPNGVGTWYYDGDTKHRQVITSNSSSDDKQIYFATGQDLFALDLEGNRQWTYENDNELWAAPSIGDGVLYQPSMNHKLYALDAATGSVRWEQDLGVSLVDAPNLVGDMLYLGGLGNKIFARKASDGSPVWEFETVGWVWESPLVQDGVAYFGDLKGNLYAVDAATGVARWPQAVPLNGAIRGGVAMQGDTLFVNTDAGFVYALKADTGETVWQVEVDPAVKERLLSTPILTSDLVIITPISAPNLVYAYQQKSGVPAWQFSGK